MAGIIFTGCKSATEKQKAAQDKVLDARKDLIDAKKDANAASIVVATEEEWAIFKKESELKIKENEIRIAELNAKIKKPGEIFDELYVKRIATLEQQNKDMKIRLLAYEKEQSNWASFKREFNHDMDAIAEAFKDLTVNNKK
jgi:DNA-directed RNA polymerase subunit N (RpoN/RPB10)